MIDHGGPYLTWNLFFTALAIPVLLLVINLIIKKAFTNFHTGWEKYHDEKEKNLFDWRTRTTNTLCDLKETIETFKQKIPGLITQDQCDDMHGDIFETINEHGRKISVIETKVNYLEKKETK
jgi:hypothetical protein